MSKSLTIRELDPGEKEDDDTIVIHKPGYLGCPVGSLYTKKPSKPTTADPETLTIRKCSPTERAEFFVTKVPANSTIDGVVMTGYTSAPPKPKSAEEWLDSRNAWAKTDPCKEGTWAFYTSEFPDKIVESLGIRRSMTALRAARKMFLIALDKVLRDHGEIE